MSEFEESITKPPMEFEGQNGLVLRQLMIEDAPEVVPFIDSNRDSFEEFASELNKITTENEAILMITNPKFAVFGVRQEQAGPLVALATVSKEEKQEGLKPIDGMVSIGIAVGENFRRQGIASGAIRAISSNIDAIGNELLQMPEVKTIRGYTKVTNRAIRKLLENCGFHLQGERPHVHVFYDLDKPMPAMRESE